MGTHDPVRSGGDRRRRLEALAEIARSWKPDPEPAPDAVQEIEDLYDDETGLPA